MKKLFKKPFFPIFILIIVILAIIFLSSSKKRALDTFNIKKAKTATVQKGNLSKYLTLAGKVDAKIYANLQFQTSGMLSWVGIKEGDQVKKYQAIASLDKTRLKKLFEKEMNDYLITDEFKRILERTQFSLNNAVLDLEISDLAVKYATLTSRTPA